MALAVPLGASITNEFMNRRRWIAVIVFWILFVASIGLDPYYPWLRVVWTVLGIGLLVVGSIYSVVETSRRGYRTGEFSYYRGVPRFLWWIVLDDEEYEKRTSKSKEIPSPDSKS
jgi:energy-coupling factor transporter transmembrane protein EcfT